MSLDMRGDKMDIIPNSNKDLIKTEHTVNNINLNESTNATATQLNTSTHIKNKNSITLKNEQIKYSSRIHTENNAKCHKKDTKSETDNSKVNLPLYFI